MKFKVIFLSPAVAVRPVTGSGAAPGEAKMTLDAPRPAPDIGVTRISYVEPLVRFPMVELSEVPEAVSAVVQLLPSKLCSTWKPVMEPAGAPAGNSHPTVTVLDALEMICNESGALGSADAFAESVADKPLPKLVIALTRNV